MSAATVGPLQGLLGRLDLESVAADVFVGHPGAGNGALFGGFVAAQAVVAAGRTVNARPLDSLHAYFLRPGRHSQPIRYVVEPVRDGRTFSTRTVVAHQADEIIFTMSANFAAPEDGIAHQECAAPATPDPDGLPDWEDLRATLLGGAQHRRPDGAVEVRVCDPESPNQRIKLPAHRRVWLRPRGVLSDDALMHAALLVYSSDRTLLRTALRPHSAAWRMGVGASLDHAVWLHQPPRFDEWLLYVTDSPVAHGGRALLLGAMYRQDGARVVSVAQEGLVRL